jgi:hypothetical protein
VLPKKNKEKSIDRQWRANGKSFIALCSNYAVCCHALAFADAVAFSEA